MKLKKRYINRCTKCGNTCIPFHNYIYQSKDEMESTEDVSCMYLEEYFTMTCRCGRFVRANSLNGAIRNWNKLNEVKVDG